MSDKPIIGITVEFKPEPEKPQSGGLLTLNRNYVVAVEAAGGVPLLIPPTTEPATIAELIDGWLIPGGDDIDASEFGEENHPKVTLMAPDRFKFEKSLFQAVDPQLPVLGICYGCQFVNVVRGGALEQHVPDRVGGTHHSGGTLEENPLDPGSLLAAAAETNLMLGKSYHHQAVGRLGAGLRTVATHSDGTVEAIEATDRPWMIGVQWHPERTQEDQATRRLFAAFVAAASDYRMKKLERRVMA